MLGLVICVVMFLDIFLSLISSIELMIMKTPILKSIYYFFMI